MIAIPCTSLTIARDRTFPIRSRTQPWGTDVTLASDRDRASLDIGNQLIRAVIRILKHLNRHRIPWVLENPHSSRLWYIPEILALCKQARAVWRLTDFCQWGTPWRKRTWLVCGNMDEADSEHLSRVCSGTKGICSRTERHHIQLSGKNEQNVSWTRVAQPYPTRLATALARALTARKFASASYNAGAPIRTAAK